MEQWKIIDLKLLPANLRKDAFRLNALGSCYYFGRVVLDYKDFSPTLHFDMCRSVEKDILKEVKEYPRGHLKALDVETPIPTPTGMVRMGDIHSGDYVLGVDGKPYRVIGESDTWHRPLYSVNFATGESLRCDADHLWETDSRRDRDRLTPKNTPRPSAKTTREIAETIRIRGERNHRVRLAGPCDGFLGTYIPPYTLGAWLGDGCSDGGRIASDDPEIISRIEKDGFIVAKNKAKFMYSILGLSKMLRKSGLKLNKHIPEEYLFASEENRRELLAGLMDTDGSASLSGQCSFSGINKNLVVQTRQLVCSLGYKAGKLGTYRARLNQEYVGEFYSFCFYAYSDNSPFFLERKTKRLKSKRPVSLQNYRQIDSVNPAGMGYCKCIMVDSPDNLYLAGEGYIPTHNTTVFSITVPMWWALPFTERDEQLMRGLGYGDEYIRWMKRAHDRNTSTLLLTETDENAAKMGKDINGHYQENAVFKETFPEILPDTKCTWNQSSMTHKRTRSSREGTYEFAGAGSALQSRHYTRIIEDDLFGEKALYSPSEAEYTIDFHRKLPGLFRPDRERPHHIGDNIVVGNRWAINDLNGWIRKNQSGYSFESHAVDGGCCPSHPKGVMIFPEMFNDSKLKDLRETLGPTAFAAQYLNNPLDASNRIFQDEWLQHYNIQNVPHPLGSLDPDGNMRWITALQHETFDGKVPQDVFLGQLERIIILDPAHSEDVKRGRSRHAIQTIGFLPGANPRFYILSSWAKQCTYSEMVDEAFKRARGWRVNTIWCEVLAGQDGWMYYLRLRNKDVNLSIQPLKKDRSAGAKERRIMALEPLFSGHKIWANRSDKGYTDFRMEYDAYKSNQTMDLLDTLGYAPQVISVDGQSKEKVMEFMRKRENMIISELNTGYSMAEL